MGCVKTFCRGESDYTNCTSLVILMALCVTCTGISQAAVITWGPVMDIVDATDVSTEGTTVEAINACSVGFFSSRGLQFHKP